MLKYVNSAEKSLREGIQSLLELAGHLIKRPGAKAAPKTQRDWNKELQDLIARIGQAQREFRDNLGNLQLPVRLGIDKNARPWSLDPSTLKELYQCFRAERESDAWMDYCSGVLGGNVKFWEKIFSELRDRIRNPEILGVDLEERSHNLRQELYRRWKRGRTKCRLSELVKLLGYKKEDAVYQAARRLQKKQAKFLCKRQSEEGVRMLRFTFDGKAAWLKPPPSP